MNPVRNRTRTSLWSCALALACASHAFGQTAVVTNNWNVPAGSRYYMQLLPAAGSPTERGAAINPLTGYVLVASRQGGTNHVHILDLYTGADVGQLDMTGFAGLAGGTFQLNSVSVAEDGVIYAANLSGATTANPAYRIYRWSDETSQATAAFGPANPGLGFNRYGDVFDVRGAGTNTQIIASGSGSTNFAVFTTVDGTNFTAQEIIVTGASPGDFGKGLAFGAGNIVWGKNSGSTSLRRVIFDLNSSTGAVLNTVSMDGGLAGLSVDPTNNLLAGVVTGTANTNSSVHRLKVYDISTPTSPSLRFDGPFPVTTAGTNASNGNIVAAADFSGTNIIGLDVNNGLSGFSVSFVTNLPPSVSGQSPGQAILRGGFQTLNVAASGTLPLAYQWRFNTNTILAGQTNSSLLLTNVLDSAAGTYELVVTNAFGSVTSAPINITINPTVQSSVAERLWSLAPGQRVYLSTDNTQRGLDYNAPSNHLILVSRVPTNAVIVLDAATGAELHTLDMSAATLGGAFAVNLVGVGDDGAVYVCNLTTAGSGFALYRWDNDSPATIATTAYTGNPGLGRVGDTMDVRGSGTNTLIIVGANRIAGGGAITGTDVVIFNTTDGINFTPVGPINYSVPDGFTRLGLAFGRDDTFWAKASSMELRHLSFDLTAGTGAVVNTYFNAESEFTNVTAIGYDVHNQMLAGIAYSEAPPNLHIFDGPHSDPPLIDQEFYVARNENLNGTGAVAFDAENGRIFSLDTNNGLLALKYAGRVEIHKLGPDQVVTWTATTATLQCATDVLGPFVDVPSATSPYTNNTPAEKYFRLRR